MTLLVPNIQPLEADVGTVTTVGRTLDRNLANVDEILQNGNNLFQGAKRAYDPNYNWLDLNLQLSPGVTGAYIAGLLRDRLAGICRRIVANHPGGLSAAVLATLNQCGNPSSGFFDPLLNDIPTILNDLSGSGGSATAQALLQQGLNQIAHATQGAGSGTGSSAPPASSSPNTPSSSSTTTTTTTPPSTTTTTQCGLLGLLLGCKPSSNGANAGSGSSSSSPSKSSNSSSGSGSGSNGGLGGLLSQTVTQSTQPTATLANASNGASTGTGTGTSTASAPNSDPSLTAPAARLLPPLPQDQAHHAHAHASHRGLVSQWWHDVTGWF